MLDSKDERKITVPACLAGDGAGEGSVDLWNIDGQLGIAESLLLTEWSLCRVDALTPETGAGEFLTGVRWSGTTKEKLTWYTNQFEMGPFQRSRTRESTRRKAVWALVDFTVPVP